LEVEDILYQQQIDKAMKRILQFSSQLNQYFQTKEPWKSPTTAKNTLWASINGVRTLSILLFPFIPNSSVKIWNQLGMKEKLDNQNWFLASDLLIQGGHLIGKEIIPVFTRIDKEVIERVKAKPSNI